MSPTSDIPVHLPLRSTTAVVFVNFHSEELITGRARRLQAAGFHVVVADNSGTFVEPGIESFDTGGNVGFGVACNVAVERLGSKIDTVCFHNPDVDISAVGIDGLHDALRSQRNPGVAVPVEMQYGVARTRGYRYPSAGRELVLGIAAATRGRADPSSAPAGVRRHSSVRGRRFGGGALWVVDRHAFEEVGGFDPGFFLYAEDLDLWHRLRLAGRSTEFCPSVEALHRPSTGSPMAAASREVLRWLGVQRFEEKFGQPSAWRRVRLAHRLVLPLYRIRCPELATWVSQQWASGCTPAETQSALRRHLEARRAGHPV